MEALAPQVSLELQSCAEISPRLLHFHDHIQNAMELRTYIPDLHYATYFLLLHRGHESVISQTYGSITQVLHIPTVLQHTHMIFVEARLNLAYYYVQILTACAWAAAFSLSSRSFSACLRSLSSRFLASFESGTGLNVKSVRVHEL